MDKPVCMTVLIDRSLKERFKEAIKKRGLKMGYVINKLIEDYTEEGENEF